MLKAGGGFGFAAEALQMRFSGPMSQTNHLESYRAVQTFLPRAIYNSLAAPADFLQQFVVAKVGECLWPIGFLFNMRQWQASNPLRVVESSYRTTGKQIEASLKQASRTKAF